MSGALTFDLPGLSLPGLPSAANVARYGRMALPYARRIPAPFGVATGYALGGYLVWLYGQQYAQALRQALLASAGTAVFSPGGWVQVAKCATHNPYGLQRGSTVPVPGDATRVNACIFNNGLTVPTNFKVLPSTRSIVMGENRSGPPGSWEAGYYEAVSAQPGPPQWWYPGRPAVISATGAIPVPIDLEFPYPLPGFPGSLAADVDGFMFPRTGRRILFPHAFVEGGRQTLTGGSLARQASPGAAGGVVGPHPGGRALPLPVPVIGVLNPPGTAIDVVALPMVTGGVLAPPIPVVRPGVIPVPVPGVIPDVGSVVQVPPWAAELTPTGVVPVARSGFAVPPRLTKEIKVGKTAAAFASRIGFNFVTELRDMVEGLWDNLPEPCKQYRKKNRLGAGSAGSLRRPRPSPVPEGRSQGERSGPGLVALPGGGLLQQRTYYTDRAAKKWAAGDVRKDQKTGKEYRIPKKGRPTMSRMLDDIYRHADCIQMLPWNEQRRTGRSGTRTIPHNGALKDLFVNQVEDMFHGSLSRGLHNLNQALGRPVGVEWGGALRGDHNAYQQGLSPGGPVDWASQQLGFTH